MNSKQPPVGQTGANRTQAGCADGPRGWTKHERVLVCSPEAAIAGVLNDPHRSLVERDVRGKPPRRHAMGRGQAPVGSVQRCTGYHRVPASCDGTIRVYPLVLGDISVLLYTPDSGHQTPTPHTPRPSRTPYKSPGRDPRSAQ